MIDIIVPVLCRPKNAQPLVDSVRSTATVPCQIIFACTVGDAVQIAASKATGENVILIEGEWNQFARKVNAAYHATANPWLLPVGDDVEFQPGWDETALAVARMSGASVVGMNDCANKHVIAGDFSTAPLISRQYIKEQGATWDDGPGFVLHPGYDHNYVDVELAEVAKVRGVWAFALEAKVCHRHPGWKTAEMDDTYRKGSSTFPVDRRLFVRRSRMWQRQARLGRRR